MQKIDFRNDILPLKDKLFRLALRITFDRAEAEDIVQETMIRVWNKRDEWDGLESVEAYCLTVARNLAIDRSEKKDSQTVELTPEAEQTPDASSPYDRLVNKERLKLVHRLVSQKLQGNSDCPAFDGRAGQGKPVQGKAESETEIYRYRQLWTLTI